MLLPGMLRECLNLPMLHRRAVALPATVPQEALAQHVAELIRTVAGLSL